MAKIHPTALVDTTADLAEDVIVGAFCVIQKGVKLGSGSILESHVTLEDDAVVGKNCFLSSHAHISYKCILEDNVYIANHVVIGSPGFGYASDQKGEHHYIAQIGNVKISSGARIDAHTCIDRAALDQTTLGNNSYIGPYSHLAHNVQVGSNASVLSHLIVAGSTKIGAYLTTEERVSITGHINLCDNISVGRHSGVNNSIPNPGEYQGFPSEPRHMFLEKLGVKKLISPLIDLLNKGNL